MKSYRVAAMILAIVLTLSACNLPSAGPTEQINPNAVFTAAAQTVEVQLTQNSLLNPTIPPATLAPPAPCPSPTRSPRAWSSTALRGPAGPAVTRAAS